MRDPDRIDPFLHELGKLWKLFPDMRFGQLVQNIPSLAGQYRLASDWHIEEPQWMEWILRAQNVGEVLDVASEDYLKQQADTEERYAQNEEDGIE